MMVFHTGGCLTSRCRYTLSEDIIAQRTCGFRELPFDRTVWPLKCLSVAFRKETRDDGTATSSQTSATQSGSDRTLQCCRSGDAESGGRNGRGTESTRDRWRIRGG